MSRTMFGEIEERRTDHGSYIDPFKVVLVGIDTKGTDALDASGEEGAEVVANLREWYSNAEVRAMLEDPKEFFSSWPDEGNRHYMYQMAEAILRDGEINSPVVVRKTKSEDGVFHYSVDDGRHQTGCVRMLRMVLAGKLRTGTPLDADAKKYRADRGAKWLPMMRAIPPTKSVETGDELDALDVAARRQLMRKPKLPELFEIACKRFRTADARDEKPDYAAICTLVSETSATMATWHRLSKMDRRVIGAFFEGKISATAAVTHAGEKKARQWELVSEMIASGRTTVADAKATKKATKRAASDAGPSDAPPAPAIVARKPWTPSRLATHVAAISDAERPPLLSVVVKLLRDGPDSLTAEELELVPGLQAALAEKTETATP